MKGQTLLEVIVTSAVGILVVSALTFAVIFSLRNATLAKNQAQATKLAQEGIERVRSGRDKSAGITGFSLGGQNVDSWDDSDLWSNQITPNCNPCYFKINSSSQLQYIGTLSNGESIPPFVRAMMLSDSATTYAVEKNVTVIVQWSDFAGSHESRLTTILRKL